MMDGSSVAQMVAMWADLMEQQWDLKLVDTKDEMTADKRVE